VRKFFGLAMLAVLVTAPDAMAQHYHGRPMRLGFHCRTHIRTTYGISPLVCPIANAKPIGRACACPAPGYGPFLRGHTVR